MPHIQPTVLLHTQAIANQHGCVVIDRANGGAPFHCLYRQAGFHLVFIGACNTEDALHSLVKRTCNLKGTAQ